MVALGGAPAERLAGPGVEGEGDEGFLAFVAFAGQLISMLWVLAVGISMIRSDQPVTAADV
jgi:hypothetical protein